MLTIFQFQFIATILLFNTVSSFVVTSTGETWSRTSIQQSESMIVSSTRLYDTASSSLSSSRRNFLVTSTCSITGAAASFVASTSPANAIPMVTADEFGIIVRDSARSIEVVEFSGPKSEIIKVVLVDGTEFGISGIVESSTDPRSPLKIAATCRENGVKAKFVDFELALNSAGSKKKVLYSNTRVQEAAVKEREKALRMQQDEENRLAELARMENAAVR